ncbi:5'-methylthioadenosine/adenosylhomocysteine nucleosidase [Paeniclostridium sordellii]|uniref:5'-methylthioadenosine/adenosylhomocysteine nucleosidase n=1 Tax=Paraclostridium sordellii TaxID=1505 RepID=UPI00210DDDD0|nr:5'-methylthioadenosine/adenosylhomocysteine nucleosidase [Paeniclostridium sordellii]MCQ4696147.1 5'-methylthioadenosine/adenosylhomocysteine nucleosidase [Paeniclostridium sordellii]
MKKLIGICTVLLLISVTMFVGCTTKAEVKDDKVLGVIGAMEEEVEILKKKMDIKETKKVAGMEFYEGTMDGKNIVLVRSGVGKVNMAACTQILIDEFKVSALVNSGVAGTMDTKLNQGDIVISTDAVQHDFDTTVFGDPLGEISRLGITFFKADKDMIDTAKKAAKNVSGLYITQGRVASGDQFVAGGEVANRIKENFGDVAAVEMEGASMAQVAYLNKVPFVILRSISDKANGEADLSYEEFLPIAAKNASTLLEEFIKLY